MGCGLKAVDGRKIGDFQPLLFGGFTIARAVKGGFLRVLGSKVSEVNKCER